MSMLARLVWVNAAMLVFLMTLDVVDQLGDGVVRGASFPKSWNLCHARRFEALAKRPRSVLTHMFTHQGVWKTSPANSASPASEKVQWRYGAC